MFGICLQKTTQALKSLFLIPVEIRVDGFVFAVNDFKSINQHMGPKVYVTSSTKLNCIINVNVFQIASKCITNAVILLFDHK